MILSNLSPIERVCVVNKVNKLSRIAVESYNRLAFDVERILCPFFKENDQVHEITEFRMLQYTIGMLISGSSALQFFDCTVYPESDLDLYICLDQATLVTDFLVRIGYAYQPSLSQDDNLSVALSNAAGPLEEVPVPWESYNGNGITGVFTFVRWGRRIQIITCFECAMHVILGFHLIASFSVYYAPKHGETIMPACVLNVISYSHAYSLYPRTTFHRRGAIILPQRYSQHEDVQKAYNAALEKYKSRGWSIAVGPCAVDCFLSSEFCQERYAGDCLLGHSFVADQARQKFKRS
ncbi:hypothetical protein VKT23_010098 [Stygiomarasmius scandens]|uniref:Uncharacterized protein n=1 Tax=Marasmiellus scandens TaxID=2682957 RepID=A0ABR1JCW4_9AGAR